MHLQHPVGLNDVKRAAAEHDRDTTNDHDTSKMTAFDPKNILNDNKSMVTYASKQTRGTLRTIEERNPYQFIEKALAQAKEKLTKMKGTQQIVDSLTDTDKKKKYLKGENRQLRDQLRAMSDNVNILIEKMNQETLKKKKYLGVSPSVAGGAGPSAA